MASFINEDFMLRTDAARQLYHGSAEKMPIIDYHCHLVPQQIAQNIQFRDITQLWLVDGHYGDHYKWRAMRANGVGEEYLTGGTHSAWETFEKWAQTMPYLHRNPLYHWSHLELSRVFGIDKILSPATAREIFEECNAKLATPEFRGQALIRRFNVETVCTTDDPADDLRWHKMIAENPFGTKVIPAWRPDKAMAIEDPAAYKKYLVQLGEAAGKEIDSYADLREALEKRHAFFASMGCKLSDHGLENFYSANYKEIEIEIIFKKVLLGKAPNAGELAKFRSAFLHDQAVMDAEAGWAQQFHIGAIRNNNSRMFGLVGPDTGYDAIHDQEIAAAGNKFFDRLASEGKLAKTILYCLNPKDNEVMMTMAYNFNDGSVPGKMQFGSGWWFLDQEVGMRRQMDALSMLGLLSRILCDVLGKDIEDGKIPSSEIADIERMVRDISYNNAKEYFRF